MQSEETKSCSQRLAIWAQDKKGMLAAGTGFLSDAYDLFVIANVMLIMSKIYPQDTVHKIIISTAALAGAVIGQIFFGVLCDRIGRKLVSIVTIFLVVMGCLASSLIVDNLFGVSIYVWLAICRFLLGIGVGGEYPLSATISSESSSDKRSRDTRVSLVFSMQGVGSLLSAVVTLLTMIIWKDQLDVAWRVALGFGAIPSMYAFVLRVFMEETNEFKEVKEKQQGLLQDMWNKTLLIHSKHKRDMLGTAGTWLIFDITFYANGLFVPTLLDLIGLDDEKSQYGHLMNSIISSVVICAIAIPGYIIAAFTIRWIGRKNLQILGFGMISLIYIMMGVFYTQLTKVPALFIFLYGLTFFFSNFGPNVTTYVLPAVTYQPEIRATCSGISAAAGKVGAVIGATIVSPLERAVGINNTLSIFGCVSITGLMLTAFAVRRRTMEEKQLDQEDEPVPATPDTE